MAPLNIAWLLQGWTVLGATSYAVGPAAAAARRAGAGLPLAVHRHRARPGAGLGRGVASAEAATASHVVRAGRRRDRRWLAALIATDRLTPAAGQQPDAAGRPRRARRGRTASGCRGRRFAGLARRRERPSPSWSAPGWPARSPVGPPATSCGSETVGRPARPHPGSDFVALVRTDRSGIWRSVPMRRGMVVLALFPGLVAVGGVVRLGHARRSSRGWSPPAARCCSG